MSYDSYQDTILHINRVGEILRSIFDPRIENHDKSKLESPEKEYFDIYTSRLQELEYGSDEYNQSLSELKVALDHHYQNNRHHPEHFKKGIEGMNLIDLIEMIVDWKAASERHKDGSFTKSLEINRKRFDISDETYNLIYKTALYLGWIGESDDATEI